MKKKILFITHLFYPARGGVETHINRLSQCLSRRGYQVKVLTTNAYSTEAFFLGDKRRIEKTFEVLNGVEVERLDFRTFGRSVLNLMRSTACWIKYPFNAWIRFFSFGPRNPLFIKKSLEFQPDLIVAAPLPTFNIYYAWKAAKILQVPLVINPAYHIHDPCSFFNPIFFRIMRECDLVAVHTVTEKEYIAEEGGVDGDKIKVFPPLPFGEKDILPHMQTFSKAEIRKKYGIEQAQVLLFLGQHGRHKNIDTVIKAMAAVWEIFPDVALVIAGGTTGYTPKLKSIASSLERTNRSKVYFLNDFPSKEKAEIFSVGDIFISLSEYESFGIVFAEAMRHKLPVIASAKSVAASIVDDYQTGLLVNPKCDKEVGGAISELLLDERIRTIYGENGRKKVLAEYNTEKILDDWDTLLSSLLTP